MTIRAFINKKLRKIVAVMLIGFTLYMLLLIYNIFTHTQAPPNIYLIAFVLVFIPWIYTFSIRCPNCNNSIGLVVMNKGKFIPDTIFSMSKNIKYCPFCGINMDSEISISK